MSPDPNENYLILTTSFSKIVEKHLPLKQKTLKRNHAPFVSKKLRKAIYTTSRFGNRFLKNPDEINRKLCSNETNVSLFEENNSNIIFLTLQVTR